MPIHIFTEAERATLDTFPAEITHDDLITFFTLSEADREQLPFSGFVANFGWRRAKLSLSVIYAANA